MSDEKQPIRLIIIGFVLLVLGVVFPLLMMIQVVESTFWLNFLSFGMQVAGLFLGFIGGMLYIRHSREKND
jgi:hypothetical protein